MPFFTHNHKKLFYREQGSGELLLILHGNTASSAMHAGELEYFGRRYHAVALDFAGTGQSERVAAWPTDWWQQGARDALALVRHLGESRAIFMGTSGGAIAAVWAAIYAPQSVRAVIADSFVERIALERVRATLAERAQRTPGQVRFWSDAHGADWEQVVEADTAMYRAFAESGGDWFGGRLPEVACPLLITASMTDSLLPDAPAQAIQMAAQVPGSQAFIFHGGGHPLMWSAPQPFRAAADAFLSQVARQ